MEVEAMAAAQRLEEEKRQRVLKKKQQDKAWKLSEEEEKSKKEGEAEDTVEVATKSAEANAAREVGADLMDSKEGKVTRNGKTERKKGGGEMGDNAEGDKAVNSDGDSMDTADDNINDHARYR